MINVEFQSPSEPLQETDITDVERVLDATLPSDYRAFLLKTNGGFVAENTSFVKLEDPTLPPIFGGWFVVDQFLKVKDPADQSRRLAHPKVNQSICLNSQSVRLMASETQQRSLSESRRTTFTWKIRPSPACRSLETPDALLFLAVLNGRAPQPGPKSFSLPARNVCASAQNPA